MAADPAPYVFAPHERPMFPVTLEPAVYVVQPDWWQVTLIGTLPGGLCLTSIRPYEAARPVRTIAGKQGIVLLGADDESRRFAL